MPGYWFDELSNN